MGGWGKQEKVLSCARGMELNSDVRTIIGRGNSKVTETIQRNNYS